MVRLLKVLLIATAATASGSGADGDWWAECPVRICDVEASSQEFQLSEAGIRYLARQRSPLYVVPVLGVYRGGKSFLMNRCMGLRAPYAGGFGVGHSQDTHTRGIFVCAEYVDALGGTVVWMDTEGLFSSEYARSQYGPRIFSLALLFSSAVLLNSVKVLNDQFFSFFAEQQQVARVLQHGLQSEGLPEGDLLPRNLSVVWVLQQPIDYSASLHDEVSGQLDAFLDKPDSEAREFIRREFQHHLHVVPQASYDARIWGSLDSAHDGDLSPDFLDASQRLRELVLRLLHSARPLQAESVANHLRMYAHLVQTEQFSGSLAEEAVQEAHLATRCAERGAALGELASELPAAGLTAAIATVRFKVEEDASEAAEKFGFGADWQARLRFCFDSKAQELERQNDAKLIERWQTEARQLAEDSGCYFIDSLIALRDQHLEEYGRKLSPEFRTRTVTFATALQRTRLVECLKLKHLIWPIVPWIAWPILSHYIRSGLVSGCTNLAMHSIVVAGIYILLKSVGRVPPYLDMEYRLLGSRPHLLDTTMLLLPWMPWVKLGQGFAALGALYCTYKLMCRIPDLLRPVGNTVDGMAVMELKLNTLLKRSEMLMEQQLLDILHSVDMHARQGSEADAALALMRGLCLVLRCDDRLSLRVDPKLSGRIEGLVRAATAGEKGSGHGRRVCKEWQRLDVMQCALRGDWQEAATHMADILEGEAPGQPQRPGPGDILGPRARGIMEIAARTGRR